MCVCVREREREPQVHAQVAPGQEFTVEWASAHNSGHTYFVLLKAADEKFLPKLTTKILDAYLTACPVLTANTAHTVGGFMKDPKWTTNLIGMNATSIGNYGPLQKFKRIGYNFNCNPHACMSCLYEDE